MQILCYHEDVKETLQKEQEMSSEKKKAAVRKNGTGEEEPCGKQGGGAEEKSGYESGGFRESYPCFKTDSQFH